MATNDIGRVTPIWRGFYSAATTYELNDIVIDTAGSVWWHKSGELTTGVIPEAGEIWDAVIDMSIFSGLIQAAITTAQTALEAAQAAVAEVTADTERAETAADNAENSAAAASESAASVGACAQAAEEAKNAAQTAASQAAASASSAGASATSAGSSAQTAEAAKTAAQTAATQAAGSAETASGAAAVVEQKKTEAIAAIEAKGEEVLKSIPEDYTELSGDVDELGEALIGTYSGYKPPLSDFEQGSIDNGANNTYRRECRMRSKAITTYPFDLSIQLMHSNYRMQIYTYTDNGEYITGGDTVTTTSAIVPKNTNFRIRVDAKDGQTASSVDYQTIYGNITFTALMSMAILNDKIDKVKSIIPFVNVKDFGAVGDGVTNDAPAIQNALEYVKTTGGTVYIPSGTYYVNTNLKIYSNTTLLLENNATLLKGPDIVCILTVYNASDAVLYNGAKNITIRGGIFDGNNLIPAGSSGINLISLSHSQNITLENITFKNTSGSYHPIECNSSKHVLINRCYFDVTGHNGAIDIDAANNSGNGGVSDHTVCEDIEIKSCYFNTNYRPAIQNHTAYAQHNIRIHECEFHFTGIQKGVIDFASTVTKVDVYNNTFISNTSEAYAFCMADEELSSTFHDNRCDMPNVAEPYSIYKNCTAYNNVINGVFTA